MHILLLDNYDSFTYNLYDYFCRLQCNVTVKRNDEIDLHDNVLKNAEAIVISPGPRRPKDAGITMQVIEAYYHQKPLLGVCLGHQAIGEFFGARLTYANKPMHGKTSLVCHQGDPLFHDIENPFVAMRYHSLVLTELPQCLVSIAQTEENEIMALKHRDLPLYGIQFHPESIMTHYGLNILKNWLMLMA